MQDLAEMDELAEMGKLTLKEILHGWTDDDVAAFGLARTIGLMGPDVDFQSTAKHVFWSNNQVGISLSKILEELVVAGVLEQRDEPNHKYKWNQTFKGTWEE